MRRVSAKANPTYYEHIFCEFINPEIIKNVYDIGVGPKSEYDSIKNRFNNITFFGTEPNPEFFQMLRGKFPGKLFDHAISEQGGGALVDFHIHPDNMMASGLIPYDSEGGTPRLQIKSITLDEFDGLCGAAEGILVWMDIEGYELKALKSGSKLLKSGRVKLLNLEVRSKWNGKNGGCTEAEIDELLASFGFRKIFSYNHYRSSHHHDSVYISGDYKLTREAETLISIYNEAVNLVDAGVKEDTILAIVDLYISRMEAADKANFLRSKLDVK